MLIIYREEAIDELVDIIYELDITQPIKVYVFSPSEDPWEVRLMMSVTSGTVRSATSHLQYLPTELLDPKKNG